jgi:hypothetical protein
MDCLEAIDRLVVEAQASTGPEPITGLRPPSPSAPDPRCATSLNRERMPEARRASPSTRADLGASACRAGRSNNISDQ